MDVRTAILLADIDRSARDARASVLDLAARTEPDACRYTACELHEAITRTEAALRALRELHPIPDTV